VVEGVIGVDGHQPVLGLGDHLLGDHHHVTVEETLGFTLGGFDDDGGKVGARCDLGDAGNGAEWTETVRS
jgi:hypothetical protein